MGLWASETGAEIGQVESELQAHEADTGNPHAVTAAQAGAIPTTEKGAAGGVASLDGSGKIFASELPPLDHDVGDAADEAGMLALSVTAPAVCIRTDFTPAHVFYLTADPATDIGNWTDTGEFGAGAANPSATVGPAAINGAANTYMRSDAAPAINLTATFAWTGDHSWTQPISIAGTVSAGAAASRAGPTNTGVLMTSAPNIADVQFFDSAHTANNRTAEWIYFQNKLQARFKNDAGNAAVTPLAFAGGQASGITGIESNSGSGVWTHIGNFVNTGTHTTLPSGGNGVVVAGTNSVGIPSISAFGAANNITLAIAGKGAANVTVSPGLQVNGDLHMSEKKIVNVGDAASARDAVNLQTLDGRLSGAQRTAIDALTPSSALTDVIAALQAT